MIISITPLYTPKYGWLLYQVTEDNMVRLKYTHKILSFSLIEHPRLATIKDVSKFCDDFGLTLSPSSHINRKYVKFFQTYHYKKNQPHLKRKNKKNPLCGDPTGFIGIN